MFFDNKQKLESEQKDTYVASVVHDLKNPLIAHSRILESIIKRSNDKIITENCKEMLSSTRLLLNMVLSITNTYKYSNGKINYNYQEINIVELLEEICHSFTFLTENEIQIYKIIKVQNETIIADKLHLKRVLTNIISNAIQYKKENTPISVELYSDENFCTFSVTNSGNYIKPQLQKEIFKKYVTNSNKFNSMSTGLGLYLAKKIIEDHNGKIFVTSTLDGTNTFGFKLPTKLKISEKIFS